MYVWRHSFLHARVSLWSITDEAWEWGSLQRLANLIRTRAQRILFSDWLDITRLLGCISLIHSIAMPMNAPLTRYHYGISTLAVPP